MRSGKADHGPGSEPSDLSGTTSVRFDYGALSVGHADAAQAAASRIKQRTAAAILDTGRDLIDVKGLLDHGQFGLWLRAEFGMTGRTAQNYMRAALLAEARKAKRFRICRPG